MLHTDDELGTVNADFLGPPGYTLPWRARYSAYGIGALLAVLAYWFMHRFGLPVNVFTVAWATLLIVLVTRKVGSLISYETPLRSLLAVLWQEMTGPRPPKPAVAVLRPEKVRVVGVDGRPVCRGCTSSHARHRKEEWVTI